MQWQCFGLKVSHWKDRKAYEKMVGQIDQAFYGALISSKRDVDDSEMDDRIGSGVRGLATRPV